MDLGHGAIAGGVLFSFKVKRQVSRQISLEPRVTRGCSVKYTLGVCRTVSGGSVEAGGATFAGLYLGIVCVSTLLKPVNVLWM